MPEFIGINRLYRYIYDFESIMDVSRVPPEHRAATISKREMEIKAVFARLDKFRLKLLRRFLRESNLTGLEALLFGNHMDELEINDKVAEDLYQSFYAPKTSEKIEADFTQLNTKYPFFNENDYQVKQAYEQFYRAYTAYSNFSNVNYSAKHSFNYLIFFYHRDSKRKNPFSYLEQFIVANNLKNASSPLVAALEFNLPEVSADKPIDLAYWRKHIMRHGADICLFEYANELAELVDAGAERSEFIDRATRLKYPRHCENPELASLCWHYGIKTEAFDKALEVQTQLKHRDRMPDVTVEMTSADGKYHYVLTKLPPGDIRGYVLGEMTACCQSIGGIAEQCVIDGMQSETSGFYVLLKGAIGEKSAIDPVNNKHYQIVAQSYAWLGLNNELVLDSWEDLAQERRQEIFDLLYHFSDRIVEQDKEIAAVLIGTKGKTPKVFESTTVYNERPRQEIRGSDAMMQWAINTTPQVGLSLEVRRRIAAFQSVLPPQCKLTIEIELPQPFLMGRQIIDAIDAFTEERFTKHWQSLSSDSIEILKNHLLRFVRHAPTLLYLYQLLEDPSDARRNSQRFERLISTLDYVDQVDPYAIRRAPSEQRSTFLELFDELSQSNQRMITALWIMDKPELSHFQLTFALIDRLSLDDRDVCVKILTKLDRLKLLDDSMLERLLTEEDYFFCVSVIASFREVALTDDICRNMIEKVDLQRIAFAFLSIFAVIQNDSAEKYYKKEELAFDLLMMEPSEYETLFERLLSQNIITSKHIMQIRYLSEKGFELIKIVKALLNPNDPHFLSEEKYRKCMLDIIEFIALGIDHEIASIEHIDALVRIEDSDKIKRCVDVVRLLAQHQCLDAKRLEAVLRHLDHFDTLFDALTTLLTQTQRRINGVQLIQVLRNPEHANETASMILSQATHMPTSRHGLFAGHRSLRAADLGKQPCVSPPR